MDEKQALQLAREALRQGDRQAGQRLLMQVLRANPRSETAWLWLSVVVADPSRKKDCLERVLRINPHNEAAKQRMRALVAEHGLPMSGLQHATSETFPGSRMPSQEAVRQTHSTGPFTGSEKQVPEALPGAQRIRTSQRGLLIGLALILLVVVCGMLIAVGWPRVESMFRPPAPPPPLVPRPAADYALTASDVPSGYDVEPRGSGILPPGDAVDRYSVTFMNNGNLLNLSGPVLLVNSVFLYGSSEDIADSAHGFAESLTQNLATKGSARQVSVEPFADEAVAFRFIPTRFSANIPVLGYSYTFRRANALVIIVVVGVDTSGSQIPSTVQISDCEFFAGQVLLKIDRALQQQ